MDLTRITVFCFAASYATALVLEVLALVKWKGRSLASTVGSWRRVGLVGITAAGLFANVVYLGLRAAGQATPLSSPADWCLIAAAVLAALYLTITIAYARWASGLFLLPIVLSLIALAEVASDRPFSPERASLFWGQTHGWLLVAATASVSVGFVAGLMYLVQSWRLKQKRPPASGFTLPSLEWLQHANSRSLALSVWFTAGGFLSGLVLSRLRSDGSEFANLWTDPVVLTSSGMLAWLLIAEVFRWTYPPARKGRKVAYLTIAAFVFLAITLVSLAMRGPHGGMVTRETPPTSDHSKATDDLRGEPLGAVSHNSKTQPHHSELLVRLAHLHPTSSRS